MALAPATESYSERLSYSPHAFSFSVLIFVIVISKSVILCETKYSALIVSRVADVFPIYMYGLHILILRLENMALFTSIINILNSVFCFVT